MKKWRKIIAAAGTVLLSFLLTTGARAATAGYPGGRLMLASEPGGTDASYVHYYKDGEKLPLESLTWVDGGVHGKALKLNGQGEILQVNSRQLKTPRFSFAGWVCGQGSADGSPDGQYGQRLFTISQAKNAWLTVSPRLRDPSRKDSAGRIPDGVYLEFHKGDGSESKTIEKWNPAVDGQTNYALPIGQWHHIAVIVSGEKLQMYIDGRLWFEEPLLIGIVQLGNSTFTLGAGIWGDPTLNALLDDVALYDFALSPAQVQMMAAGVDPLGAGATLPAETGPHIPTRPASQASVPGLTEPTATQNQGEPAAPAPTVFGLPVWTVCIIAAILLLFAGLSVWFSFFQNRSGDGKEGRR